MSLIQIRNRWSGEVLFEHDVDGNIMAITVIAALENGAILRKAILRKANLRDSDLSDVDLSGANLSGADLSGANLSGADLRGANLSGANLSGAYLRNADLVGAYLRNADMTPVRDDIWSVLSAAPAEVPALIAALKSGRVDGSTYKGECSCLVGTVAQTRGVSINELGALKPDSNRPAEQFFMGIRKGDTPETSQFSALAAEWSQQWLDTMTAAFGSIKQAN